MVTKADIAVTIGAHMDGFERDLSRASSLAQLSAGRMEAAFAGVGKALAGLGVGAALTQIVTSTANTADALSKLAQRSGIAVESLSALAYAASLNDASLTDLEQGLKGLSNKMLDAAKGGKESVAAFSALGVSIKDAGGNLRATDAVFADIAEAFSQMQDGATKTALAQRLMEESGIKLIPTLNSGKEGLQGMADEARRFGAIVTEDLADASVAFNDNLTRLNTQLAVMGRQIGSELIPTLAVATEGLTKFGEQSAVASRFGEGLNQVFTLATVSLTTVTEKFGVMASGIGAVAAQIAAVLRGDFGQVAVIAEEFNRDVEASSLALSDLHFRLIEASKGAGQFGASQGDAAEKTKRTAAVQAALSQSLNTTAKSSKSAADATDFLRRATSELEKELKAVADFLAEVTRNQTEGEQAALDQLRTLQETLAARRQDNELIGLTATAIADVQAARLENLAALKLERAEALAYFPEGEKLAAIYRAQAEALRDTAAEVRDGAVKQAAVDSADEALRAWQDISNDIADSLTDAIIAGGSDGWDLLKRQIEATVIRATVVPVVQGAVNNVLQSVGLGPGGALGSAGSAANLIGAGASAASLIGANLVGAAGGDALGALIAGNASSWGVSAAGVTGGASVMGSVAAAAPYIAAALIAAQALGVFDGTDGPHRGGAAFRTIGGPGGLATNATTPGFGLDWGAFRSDRSAATDEAVAALIESLAASVATRAARFGADASGLTFAGKFAADPDNARGGLRVAGADGTIFQRTSANTSFEALAGDAARAELAALQSLALPAVIEQIIDGLDPMKASLEQIGAALSAADAWVTAGEQLNEAIYLAFTSPAERLDDTFAALGQSIPATRDAFEALVEQQDLATESGRAVAATLVASLPLWEQVTGQIEAQVDTRRLEVRLLELQGEAAAALALSRELELEGMSEAEAAIQRQIHALEDQASAADAAASAIARLQSDFDAITGQIAAIAEAVAPSRDNGVQANIERLNALRGGSASITDQIFDLMTAAPSAESLALVRRRAAELSAGLADSLTQAADIQEIVRLSVQAVDIEAAIDRAGLQRAADEAFARQFDAFEALRDARELELDAIDSQIDSIRTLADDARTLEGNVRRLSDVAERMRQSVAGLRIGDLSVLNPEQQLGAARGEFERLLALAETGDESALGDITAAGTAYLEEARAVFASSSQYVDAFSRVTSALAALGVDAGSQASDGQRQLDALNTQIDRLDALVEQRTELRDALAALEAPIREQVEIADVTAGKIDALLDVRDVVRAGEQQMIEILRAQAADLTATAENTAAQIAQQAAIARAQGEQLERIERALLDIRSDSRLAVAA